MNFSFIGRTLLTPHINEITNDQYFVVVLLIKMWNVDQSYMTITLNLTLSRIAGQIASRMKYLRNAGKFAKCGTITQNA